MEKFLDRDVQKLVRKLLAQLDCPKSLGIHLLMENGQWDDIADQTADPSWYMDSPWGAKQYFDSAQAVAVLRKYPHLPTSFKKEENAMSTFWLCEKQNCETNLRLDRHLEYPVFETELQRRAEELFSRARRWLKTTLGTLPTFLNGRFGPGSTYESKEWDRRGVTAYDKLSNSPTVTHGASFLEDHLVWQTGLSYAWDSAVKDRSIPRVRGNRFTTVPKTSKTDRGICIEPGLNVWAQLAVGGELRRRLRKRTCKPVKKAFQDRIAENDCGSVNIPLDELDRRLRGNATTSGIDLTVNQGLHRRMAMEASLSGRYATIDLSNASDTLSYSLVKLLLPDEWFDLLVALRSPFTNVKGRWVKLEKFSSMGNGFTFELETLIFSALVHAVGGAVGRDSFIYGDDIIVPVDLAREVIALLRYSGFTPNEAKTFSSGVFRESCGGDFFSGFDVRPYFLKESPNDPAQWIGVANGLWKVSGRILNTFRAARYHCLDNVPVDIRRNRGPSALGDLIIHDSPSRWTYVIRSQKRFFRVWRPVPRRLKLDRFGTGVQMSTVVLGLPSTHLSPRGSVAGFRFGRLAHS